MKLSLVWMGLFVGLVFAPLSADEGSRDAAVEILTRSDNALKAVTSVRYHSVSTPEGIAVNFVKPSEGEALLFGWIGQLPEKMYVDVKVTDGEEVTRITGGGDGDSYFVIDHNGRKGYEDMDTGVLGGFAATLRAILVPEFVHEAPMGDEISAETIELLEDHEVSGEACHQIRVVYSGGRGESVWSIAKSDDLPRQRKQVFNTPQGVGSLTYRLVELEIDPKFDDSAFKMKLPEGYERIDDFAPM